MKGINRVVIAVKDIDKAKQLFTELLGIHFQDFGIVESHGIRAMVSWEGGIELVSPISTEGDIARFVREKGEGIQGMIFNVDDADQAAIRSQTLGIGVKGIVGMEVAAKYDMYKKFKEVLLESEKTYGATIALAEIEMK